MSETIFIRTSREAQMNQFACIKQIENYAYRKEFGGAFIIILTIMFVIAVFYLFPDDFVEIKAVFTVLLALAWIVVIPVALWLLMKRWRTNRRVRRAVQHLLEASKTIYLQFDVDSLVLGNDIYRSELKWSYFASYLESPSTLLLFTKDSIYNSVVFSASEIGIQNWKEIRSIVRNKLPLLNEKIRLEDKYI